MRPIYHAAKLTWVNMATLAELKKALLSETMSVKVRKQDGIPYAAQEKKVRELAVQIAAMEKATTRLGALLAAVDRTKK